MNTREAELLDKVGKLNRQLGRLSTQETPLDLTASAASGYWARAYRIYNVNSPGNVNAYFGAEGYGTGVERAYVSLALGSDNPGEANLASINLLTSGDVGIGTFTPESRLHVFDPTSLGTSTGSANRITQYGGDAGGNAMSLVTFTYRRANTATDWTTVAYVDGIMVDASFGTPLATLRTYIERHPNSEYIAFGSGATEFARMNSTGLGVGVTPGAALHVKGTNANIYLDTPSANQTAELRYYDGGSLKGRLLYAGGNGAGAKYFGFINTAGDYLGFFSATHRFWNLAGSSRFADFTATATWLSPRGTSSDLYVNSSGSVGIGTASPNKLLTVQGASYPAVAVGVDSTHQGMFEWDTVSSRFNIQTSFLSYPIVFNSDVLFVDTSGNKRVGIGTTSPGQVLQVNGNGFINAEDRGWGVDAQATPRLGMMKYSGQYPIVVAGGSSPLILAHRTDADNVFGGSLTRYDLYIESGGKVGIANSDPGFPLDVSGRSRIRSTAALGTAGLWFSDSSKNDRAFFGLSVDSASPKAGIYIGGAWRVTVDSAGLVGIGTESPSTILHVKGASPEARLESSSSNQDTQHSIYDNGTLKGRVLYKGTGAASYKYFGLYNDAADYLGLISDTLRFESKAGTLYGTISSGYISFGASNALYLTSGNAVIGGSTATHKLTVNGNVGPGTDNANSCGTSLYRWTAVYAVNGTIQTSDQRAKTDVADSVLGLDFINRLRPVAYKWKAGGKREVDKANGEKEIVEVSGKRTHFGLLAQEVRAALPDGVDFGGWILDDVNDPDSGQSLAYHEFIAPLIRAVQELANKVKVLEKQLN